MTDSIHGQPATSQTSSRSLAGAAAGNDAALNRRGRGLTRSSETRKAPDDFMSDAATAAFIRRTLCLSKELLGPSEKGRGTPRPIEEVLPPLTSSNSVDLQLYAIISVIIKEFVQTWYSRITPDQEFVDEVIQIIAHCTRALEQRLRNIDLEALVFDEIPALLEGHLKAFRIAQRQTSSSHSLVSDPRVVYHALNPHPALSPVPSESIPSSVLGQRENESMWRQMLVQGLLAVLLPTEDLENGCLRALVAEIFAEMILGNGISGKVCEGWLLWEGITKVAEVLRPPTDDAEKQIEIELPPNSLDRYGLLSTPVPGPDDPMPSPQKENRHGAPSMISSAFFWTILQYAVVMFTWLRAILLAAVRSSSLPARSTAGVSSRAPSVGEHQWQDSQPIPTATMLPLSTKRPMLSMKLWSCVSQLVQLDRRMPWLSGFASSLHWLVLAGPGRVGATDGVLDRSISHYVQTRILTPTLLPTLLRTMRATLFPNNTLGPARQPPTAEEAKQIRRRCAVQLLSLVPSKVASIFLASESTEVQIKQVEESLLCLEDPYLNKHLIFQIVELAVLRLVPELGERGVKELLDDRLG